MKKHLNIFRVEYENFDAKLKLEFCSSPFCSSRSVAVVHDNSSLPPSTFLNAFATDFFHTLNAKSRDSQTTRLKAYQKRISKAPE
ncbi:CLUMA_CG019952, isoform A [Clunio marinus]|uniref:CLUMA_CG019952, isoform A n=1 Tax=Clunio marinus TaxID=568069 RepID=A0A1J1J3A5_9DIPT|nr:CLUMA_CG019952, isoform A [Clunio marinus]